MSRREVIENAARIARLGLTPDETDEIMRISRSLRRIGERQCNEYTGCRRCDGRGFYAGPKDEQVDCKPCGGTGDTLGKREARLLAKAQAIAAAHGLLVYHQGDPRGAALHLYQEEALWRDFTGGPMRAEPREIDSCYSSVAVAVYA